MQTYLFEVTDTFGGEANYCWVRRYKVEAKSINGALRKVSRDSGYQGRIRPAYDGRWNVQGAAICIFGEYMDDGHVEHYNRIEL